MTQSTPIRATLAALVAATAVSATAETVTIRADTWYPMNGEPGADKPGYMIELARAIFKQHDHSVEYSNLPWERSLKSVREGRFDCVVGAYKSDAPDFVFPEAHWGYDESAFYVPSDSDWSYDGMDSLSGVTIATIGGYSYGDAFDAYAEDNPGAVETLNANNALEKNIRKLAGGRVDALLESPAVLEAQLQEMGMSGELERAGTLGEPVPMYIACSPANKERSEQLTRWVTEGTQGLRESGQLETILNRYGLSDWQ